MTGIAGQVAMNDISIDVSILDVVLDRLSGLSGEEFQDLIYEYLLCCPMQFHSVVRGPYSGPDGGVDIKATARFPTGSEHRIIFECKGGKSPPGRDAAASLLLAAATTGAREAVLVSPSQVTNSFATAANEVRDKIEYKNWTHHNLASSLIERAPQLLLRHWPELRPSIPFRPPGSELVSAFEIIEPAKAGESADRFYDGYTPLWSDLEANFDIPRLEYIRSEGLKEAVTAHLNSGEGIKLIGIRGAAGAGKSTVLRRAAYDLAKSGFDSLRLLDDWQCSGTALSRQITEYAEERKVPIIISIDSASQLNLVDSKLDSLLVELANSALPAPIAVVVADEINHWHRLRASVEQLSAYGRCQVFTVDQLLDDEISELVDRIWEYEENGCLRTRHCELTRAERINLCSTEFDRYLIVAMLRMRHGAGFRELLYKEYDRLAGSSQAQLGYALLCYFGSLGLSIPSPLLYRASEVTNAVDAHKFGKALDGLAQKDRRGLRPRHSLIANIVARYALNSGEARMIALRSVLGAVKFDIPTERDLFLHLTSREGVHRRILRDLDRNVDLVQEYYEYLVENHSSSAPRARKYIYGSKGMIYRLLKDTTTARECFSEASALDGSDEFPLRQLAWISHSEGRWDEAAELVRRAAALAPTNVLAQWHCARLLTLNTMKNFRSAGEYYERALELAPADERMKARWEDYKEAAKVAEIVTSLREDDAIPDYLYPQLRPGLSFLVARHGHRDKAVRNQLQRELQGMLRNEFVDTDDLEAKLDLVNVGESKRLRSLVSGNLARALYQEWYHRDVPHSPESIERLFLESIELFEDAFVLCWYGTFLKEVKNDLAGARRHYELALKRGNSSRDDRLHDHPLFLNNLALLVVREVRLGLKPRSDLQSAYDLFAKTVERVSDLELDFVWPEASLQMCKLWIGAARLNTEA